MYVIVEVNLDDPKDRVHYRDVPQKFYGYADGIAEVEKRRAERTKIYKRDGRWPARVGMLVPFNWKRGQA